MEIQSICESIGKNGCLMLCDCYIAGIDPMEAVRHFNKLAEKRIVLEDCYVLDHCGLIYFFTGEKFNYLRTSSPPNNRLYISSWSYNGRKHFVVMKDGQVVWNPLDNSVCVTYGRETGDYRFLE